MKTKVYDGNTPDQHLCQTCAASIVRTERGIDITICQEMPGQHPYITGKVTSCTAYTNRKDTHRAKEFRAEAWHLDKDEDGNLVWRTPADRNSNLIRIRRVRNPVRAVPSDPSPVVQ